MGSLFLFIGALLSKELAVIFPLFLCAWGYYSRRFTEKWFLVRDLLPFLAVAAVYALLRSSVLKFSALLVPELQQYPLWLRFAILPQVIGTYGRILVLPVDLHMSWTLIRPVTSYEIAIALAGAVSAVFLAGYAFFAHRRRPAAASLFAWAVIFFLPQSGLYPINAFVAEHFIYLPSIAVFAAAAWVLRRCLRRALAYACVAGIVAASCALTAARNYEWRDPITFYARMIELSPSSYTAHVNLGVEYLNRKKYDLAEEALQKALRIKPDRIEGYSNLAAAYYQAGKYEQSLDQYWIVERMVPYFKAGEVQNNIGLVLLELKRYDEALARLNLACTLDPSLSFPHYNSAHVLMRQGREVEAVNEIVRSFPPGLSGHDGDTRFIEAFRQTLRVEDFKAPATLYNNLGVRLLTVGFDDWGYVALQKALDIMPDYADVHCNIGFFYLTRGEKQKARVAFRRALASDPRHAKAAGLLRLSK
jgi:Tfp pilus assembly protein PilF